MTVSAQKIGFELDNGVFSSPTRAILVMNLKNSQGLCPSGLPHDEPRRN